uniref:Cytochrome c assembly protein n=1 Tax=Medicago truncatula TaxID=3880 RepID=A2Q595_MEDTR|nr:Cytochrome c assembly protein [Medicago truncatula]
MIITFFCVTGLLITRWFFSGHLPFSDLYESLIFLSWGFSIFHMVPCFKKEKNLLSTIIAPSVIFTQGFATSGLLTKMHQSVILVPTLQSHWLMMHSLRFKKPSKFLLLPRIWIFLNKSVDFVEIKYMNMNERNNVLRKTSFYSSRNYYRSQFIQQLDRWGYRIISLGFLFLTIGILSGAVWANEAWGSYWNWDPKETWAFITWTIFAIYLHTRKTKKFEGVNSSIVASIGFLIIWICYLGINLLGIGLHSYGSFTSN